MLWINGLLCGSNGRSSTHGVRIYVRMEIGHDYNWGAHGWEVIFNPKYEQLQAGDIINWHPGGAVSPGVYGHTGVIYSVDNNGNFSTYEQNAEKGRVCAKTRKRLSHCLNLP